MGSPYAVAAIWIGLAFASALISTRTGIAVSLVEILVGALVGNLFQVQTTSWIDFLAGFGSGLLTCARERALCTGDWSPAPR